VVAELFPFAEKYEAMGDDVEIQEEASVDDLSVDVDDGAVGT